MYKSSPLTFFFRFIFPVLMILSMSFAMFIFWTSGDQEAQNFIKGFSIIALWVLIFVVQMPFRLRKIETSEDGIYIYNFREKAPIKYQDIKWVCKLDLTCPWATTIKYTDIKTGLDKKVSYFPNQNNSSKDLMAVHIQKMIETKNTSYSEDSQPSVFKNVLLLSILVIPFMFGFLYFSGILEKIMV